MFRQTSQKSVLVEVFLLAAAKQPAVVQRDKDLELAKNYGLVFRVVNEHSFRLYLKIEASKVSVFRHKLSILID